MVIERGSKLLPHSICCCHGWPLYILFIVLEKEGTKIKFRSNHYFLVLVLENLRIQIKVTNLLSSIIHIQQKHLKYRLQQLALLFLVLHLLLWTNEEEQRKTHLTKKHLFL